MSHTFSSFDFSTDPPRFAVPAYRRPTERLVIAGIVFLTVVLIAVKPGLVHYEFPAITVLAGIFFYRCNPATYVAFTLWLYFLSPFIRRIVDFRSSWMDPNPILLAPLLTALISGWFLCTSLNHSWFEKSVRPYLLAVLAIGAGAMCGLLINPSKKDVLVSCLNWLSPVCFGYYIAQFSFKRGEAKEIVTRTFVAGILVMGVYGIYQFLQAPAWDCNWLELMNSGDISVSVMGRPEPFGLRVWGTMNSPGPFSTALTAGLLLLFADTRKARIPAAVTGYISFLLTLVRSGWLGWGAGMAAIAASNKKYLSRMLVTVGVASLLLLPAMLYQPIADTVQSRFSSFQSIEDDESGHERAVEYASLSEQIAKNPFGFGLTNKDRLNNFVLDSTLLRLPLQLGWIGCFLYIAAIALLFRRMFPLSTERGFAVVARAIAISILVRAPFGQVLTGFDGVVLWMSCGLVIAELDDLIPRSRFNLSAFG